MGIKSALRAIIADPSPENLERGRQALARDREQTAKRVSRWKLRKKLRQPLLRRKNRVNRVDSDHIELDAVLDTNTY